MSSEMNADTARQSNSKRYISWVVVPLVIFVAMAVLFGLALRSGDPSTLPSALIGKLAPEYDFPALEGVQKNGQPIAGFAYADHASGQPTVVNFFASWCGPCRLEHPVLKQLKSQTNVRMVGVNYKDKPPGGVRFLQKLGNPYDLVGADANGRGAIEWGLYGVPETFVLDGQGRIVYKHVGPVSEADLKEKLLPAIKQAGG